MSNVGRETMRRWTLEQTDKKMHGYGGLMRSETQERLSTDGYEQRLVTELSLRRTKRLQGNIHHWTPRTNNASQISTCALQMWYARMRPTEKRLWDVETQATVEDGRDEEKKVIAELMGDGWEIEAGQAQVDIKDAKDRVILTGKIDGKIRWEGHKIPLEIKRVKPYVFTKIQAQGVDALQRTPWTRRYLWQINTYLYQHNEPVGILIVSDGQGHKVFVPVFLDLAIMEDILTRCEFVEQAVSLKAEPTPLPTFDGEVCGHCEWLQICSVKRGSAEAEIVVGGELADLLDLRENMAEAAEAYEEANRRIKHLVKERAHVLVSGKWLITGEWKTRLVKMQSARTDRFWQTTIARIDGDGQE